MGLTEQGYIRKTYDDILNDKIQRAKELFGEDIDTGDQTPLGKFIRINTYDQALAEEEAELIYYSRFPNSASGHSLDRLMVFGAITRNPAEPATFTVQFNGESGHTIPAGTLVSTDTDLTFYTLTDAVIGESGSCTVEVCCSEPGTVGNVNASAINKLVTIDASIADVAGVERLNAGKDEESDADLRARFTASIAGSGSCNANAIRAALLRIPTVKFADVVENDGSEADSEGRPPQSFECYVLGGDDYVQEIGEAIFDKRPIGIKTVGDKAVTVIDSSGNERTVYYSPAPNVNILMRVKVQTNSEFPEDGNESIKTNVTDYINSLGIGKSFVLSKLYGEIYKVPGVVDVTSIQASTDGGTTYGADNVAVPRYGVAVCEYVIARRNDDDSLIILEQPESFSGFVGETAVFRVIADGDGLTYRWYILKAGSTEWAVTSMTGNRTATLTVGAAADRNGNQYRCVVTDANGNTVTSEAAMLTITDAAAVAETVVAEE